MDPPSQTEAQEFLYTNHDSGLNIFQKVYYKVMKVGKSDSFYESIVRTCSVGRCYQRDDFVNCTLDKLENPGCTKRLCCNDRDLCNQATSNAKHTLLHILPYFILLTILWRQSLP